MNTGKYKIAGTCFIIFPVAVSVLLIISCGFGEGTISITTYPVAGEVVVDGVSHGDTPVALTLPAGKHEVKFLEYSDQYTAPGTRIVTIKKGEHKKLLGEYVNRFIPRDLPSGFSSQDSLSIYGVKDRPLKDGIIFDYINGGGLVYLKYGLRETTHAVFRDEKTNEITVDIFDMGTPGNALAAFSDEEVCPAGYEECEIISDCKAYHYEPDFLIYFHKSRYLVYISTTDDSFEHAVKRLGRSVFDSIQCLDKLHIY